MRNLAGGVGKPLHATARVKRDVGRRVEVKVNGLRQQAE